jgi:hypothetical protein
MNTYINIDHNHCLDVSTEQNLQRELVKFLNRDDHWLFSTTLGGTLDTDDKRINAKKDGYLSGVPDFVIFTKNKHHSGVLLEIKKSNGFGIISKKQMDFFTQSDKANDFLQICSNDLLGIIEMLTLYRHNIKINFPTNV